jgi:hypothetical protein
MRKMSLVLVPALAAGLITLSATSAQASTFVVYEGSHYTGRSVGINACGMSNIPYNGSYKWYATGQSARMYNQPNGAGVGHYTFSASRNGERPEGFGWKSIIIHC